MTRLEEIKENWFDDKDPLWILIAAGQDPHKFAGNVRWLIEQAEKVQELKAENESKDDQIERLRAELKLAADLAGASTLAYEAAESELQAIKKAENNRIAQMRRVMNGDVG